MVSSTKTALVGEGMSRGRCRLLVAVLFSVNFAQAYFLLSYISDNNLWLEKHNLLEMKLNDMSYKAQKFEEDSISCHSKEKELEDSSQDLERDVQIAKDSATKALKELSASNDKYNTLHSFYKEVKILLEESYNTNPSGGEITLKMLTGILSQVKENATALQRKNGDLESDLAAASKKVTALQADFTACKGEMADALQREVLKSNACREHLKTAEDEIRTLQQQLKQARKNFEDRKSLENSSAESTVRAGEHNSKAANRKATVASSKEDSGNGPRAGPTSSKQLVEGNPGHQMSVQAGPARSKDKEFEKSDEGEGTGISRTEIPVVGGGEGDKQGHGLKDNVRTDAVEANKHEAELATANVMATPVPYSDQHKEGTKTFQVDTLTRSDGAGDAEDNDNEEDFTDSTER